MSFQLIDNGLHIDNGQFQYAWYQLAVDGQVFYRVASLRELAAITLIDMDEADMLGKTVGAIRGLYNAKVNFIYSACGIYTPEHIGIVQLYGAAANGASREEAASKAAALLGAVEATLANFPQSRTRTPDLEIMRWYLNFLTRPGQNPLAILGYPDPRVKHRGMSADGTMVDESADDLSPEQNEILFRGLARLRENFVFQINCEHIPRHILIDGLMRLSQATSNVASRQKGSKSIGFSLGIPILTSLSNAYSGGYGAGVSQAHSQADGASQGWGNSHTDSQAHTESNSSSVAYSQSWSHVDGVSSGQGHSSSWGQSDSLGHSVSQGVASGHTETSGSSSSWSNTTGESFGTSVNANASLGFEGTGVGGGVGASSTVMASSTVGGSSFHSASDSMVHSSGVSDSTGHAASVGGGESSSQGISASDGESFGLTHTFTHGTADTVGHADGASQSWGQSHTDGDTLGTSQNRAGSQAVGMGISTGFAPGISVGQSWQTEDLVAERTTEVLKGLVSVLNQASAEGGFLTDALLFPGSEPGFSEAAALVPQAFHGPGVPTPVFTVRPRAGDAEALRDHAIAFLPCTIQDPGDPFGGILGGRYSTLLTAGQVAAYTAPAILQEGTLRIVAPIPEGIAFYPRMSGDVVLGHQFSPTTRLLTTTQVRLEKARMMHTLFAGNTGFGKSVAAMRMVYEMALHWGMRIVVLDFGFAWRSLLNAPGLEERVDIRQLRPDGVRPLRWNPLQIGTFVNPETQLKAFADMFGTIAQLGQKQQQHRLLDSLRTVYLCAGVLVDDPEVRGDPEWGKVGRNEVDLAGADPGTALSDLTPEARQRLTVYRSSKVGLLDLYQEIERQYEALPPRDIGRGVLEGILWRLKSLVRGAAAAQFAPATPGNPTTPVEDLGRPDGVVILEGGKFLDNFAKAWLLGWAGWLIYSDMVARRERQINSGEADLFLVYEEANIIFSGLDGGEGETSSGPSVSEQQSNMFRDSRKYGCFFGVVTQSPSLIPSGITSSCNNLVVGYLTAPRDKDIVLSALARSEKGFHDEPWRRFLADLQIGMTLGKFPYAYEREQQQPFLFQPLILNVPESSDAEIEIRLGRIPLL